ncbi:MAG: class I SAM-dependent methyltransferase [Candidatus Neomarinimicrobiota bacterium]
MGIAIPAARLLMDEHFRRPFSGSVLELGKQHIWFSLEELRRWAPKHNVNLIEPDAVALSDIDFLRKKGCIDDVSFFKAMGFQAVESCDVSDYEGADHVLDLNLPVPEKFHNSYDVIVDGGTLEHIFNLPQVLKNIFSMLKPGGRIIHLTPSSNFVDHGFYMFSPTLFFDYYTVNRWNIVTNYLINNTVDHEKDPWKIYAYTPGCIDHLSYGGFDKGNLTGLFIVAEKSSNSTADKIPQQFDGRKSEYSVAADTDFPEGDPTLLSKIEKFLRVFPRFHGFVEHNYNRILRTFNSLFRKNRMPSLIKKY